MHFIQENLVPAALAFSEVLGVTKRELLHALIADSKLHALPDK